MFFHINPKFKFDTDALGISVSLACAIHCAVLPLLFSSVPLFGVNIVNNVYFEIFMIVLAFVIGTFSLYHGYKKHHHHSIALILFSVGIILLLAKQFLPQYENWFLFPAAVLIITAHFVNYRLCRVANHCHASDCNH
ncbi:MAG: MerC domain-containing protein [Sphingobacteriales bacterium]|nr:MAG: MerC domain-containing protein [Sphingobacteriales bacterium]